MEKIFLTTSNNEEIECEIIFTFESDEFNKSYVLYKPIGLDLPEENVFAASYVGDVKGVLEEVKTEEEWEMINEVLYTFSDEEE